MPLDTAQGEKGIIMANRNWASGGKIYSMHVMPVIMNVTVQVGATGAVTSIVGSGIASVARASAGVYLITMQAQTNFNKLYFASGSLQSPPSGLSGVSTVEIQNAPNASVATAAGGQLTVKCLDAAGAVVDPASGSALNVLMLLSNSSVLIDGE